MRVVPSFRAVMLLLIPILAADPVLSSEYSVTDGDFQPLDWDVSLFDSSGGGDASGTQVASGGNPGAYRRSDLAFSAREYGIARAFHRYVPFVFDASVQGPLLAVDYSEDAKSLSNSQAAAPALRQGGLVFVGPTFGTTSSWVHHAFTNLDQNDFVTLSGADHPDFSALGAPIEFGFFRGNSGEGSWSTSAAIDNWSITIQVLGDIVGACCDGSTGACILVPESGCLPPGAWHGEWPSCTPNPCPLGSACCLGTDCIDRTEAECAAVGGFWVGGILCALDPCDMIPGFCCLGQNCTIESATACANGGGVWGGPYSDCDPDPCLTVGACCALNGNCSVTSAEECAGIWVGVGAPCFPDPCITIPGACCEPDGACRMTTAEECAAPDSWQGLGTECSPNECIPMGACCYSNGECEYLTWADCLSAGGVYYMGVGSSCTPNPCPTSSVENGATDGIPPQILSVSPNPSPGLTVIRYQAFHPAGVEIYSLEGALIRRLADASQGQERRSIDWDGCTEDGIPVPSGIYLVRVVTPAGQTTGKLTIAR